MTMISFQVDGATRSGYLALPKGGSGPGVLVLHAWWGLNDFFKSLCDRLAAQGFVAFAPDVHHGKLATTVDEAESLLKSRDAPAARATAEGGLQYLKSHPGVRSGGLGAVGFSMGAAYAMLLDSLHPETLTRIVLFYGTPDEGISKSKARFQGHFGEEDEWEPIEDVRKITPPNAEIHIYPRVGHWFFESDRPDAYRPEAAALAWDRTVAFLGGIPKDH